MELNGFAASAGYVVGQAFVLRPAEASSAPARILPTQIDEQRKRFLQARETCRQRVSMAREMARREDRGEEAEILDAYDELLGDDDLRDEIAERIASYLAPAEQAVAAAFDAIIAEMGEIADEYARQRIDDFAALKNMLLGALAGDTVAAVPGEPMILVGRELTPADTMAIDKSLLLGIVCEKGGWTSHVGIIARSLGVPAVVGAAEALNVINSGDVLAVDGQGGRVVVNPSDDVIDQFRRRHAQFVEENRQLESLAAVAAVTQDGRTVRLCANIASDREAEAALRHGADGIGLMRTEFLFLDRDSLPSEDEQYAAYRRTAASMPGKEVIIRTLDVGGDKPLPYLPLAHEANPFLGRRGVRLYRDWPEVIRTQLRAVLRASSVGNIHVMFPMITALEEVVELRTLFAQVSDELRQSGAPIGAHVPLGIMIETPAAAMIADRLIAHVDFFSIGVNDLTQYTLAIDRGSEQLAAKFDPLHPAVLRLIKIAVDASHAAGKWTGVCGELAGDESSTQLLVGLGVDELSMSPASIPRVKQAVLRTTRHEASLLARQALAAATACEVHELLAQ